MTQNIETNTTVFIDFKRIHQRGSISEITRKTVKILKEIVGAQEVKPMDRDVFVIKLRFGEEWTLYPPGTFPDQPAETWRLAARTCDNLGNDCTNDSRSFRENPERRMNVAIDAIFDFHSYLTPITQTRRSVHE